MTSDFTERLNRILDRITADDFLHGQGLGNEIPFYAFDYPPGAIQSDASGIIPHDPLIPRRSP